MEEIQRILPSVLMNHLTRSDTALLGVLTPLWPRFVGEAIARQCRPVAYTSGTLTIGTSSPTWAIQLRQLSAEICARLNEYLGREIIKKVRVREDLRVVCAESRNDGAAQPSDLRGVGWLDAPDSNDEVTDIVRRSYAKYFARHNRNKVA